MISLFAVIPVQASAKSDSLAFLAVFKPLAYLDDVQVDIAPTSTVDPGLTVDDRAERIDAYFSKRNMPLAGYGEQFVKMADKCDIDWRLLPAIGVRESSGGKFQYNNNPFGWGSAKIRFKDFSQAIDVVSDNLCGLNDATAKYYKDKTTYQRLWYYNGTVIPSYPQEVIDIMEMI
jgi:hypothetical protein